MSAGPAGEETTKVGVASCLIFRAYHVRASRIDVSRSGPLSAYLVPLTGSRTGGATSATG